MFRCAIIGVSGFRANGLAQAYSRVRRGKLVAVATRNLENLQAFGDKYGVPARYQDYHDLFIKERPDLVHVNLPPTLRLEVIQAAEAAGITALLVEKPIALDGADWLALHDLAPRLKVKVAINHQLHFHPRRQALQRLVADGAIGQVRLVDASCGMHVASQGTHVLQSIRGFLPKARPLQVLAACHGFEALTNPKRGHFSPDGCTAMLSLTGGITAHFTAGPTAPRISDNPLIHQHKRIAVYGDRGRVLWTMNGYECHLADGTREAGTHDYGVEDLAGQAALTEAMFDWLESPQVGHPLDLVESLAEVNTSLGIYLSAIERRPVNLPCAPAPDTLARLRVALGGSA
jgi:predicted dehydrogenase